MEIEGEGERRGRQREYSRDGGAVYERDCERDRHRERRMQIFSLDLLKQRRKDPSSSLLPNFNLQMSFCLLSGAAVKCFIWH